MQPLIAVGQGDITKLVKEKPHWHGQRSLMHFVCLIVKLLKSLCIEHTDEKIERIVVAVRDDAKNCLFPFSQPIQLQGIPPGEVLDVRRVNTDRRTAALTKMDFSVLPAACLKIWYCRTAM